MRTYTYPHTIENGAGERLTFLRRVQGSSGARLEVENLVEPGSGPPMHVHHHQEEALTIQQGRVGYQRLGEQPQFAESGETVVFEPGEAHRFWNAGEEDLRCTGYIQPADNLEYLLTALSSRSGRTGGAGRIHLKRHSWQDGSGASSAWRRSRRWYSVLFSRCW